MFALQIFYHVRITHCDFFSLLEELSHMLNCTTNDRFAKVRPLFKEINDRFKNYAPHVQNHFIDESMVPYYGRHGCKQFIRRKEFTKLLFFNSYVCISYILFFIKFSLVSGKPIRFGVAVLVMARTLPRSWHLQSKI